MREIACPPGKILPMQSIEGVARSLRVIPVVRSHRSTDETRVKLRSSMERPKPSASAWALDVVVHRKLVGMRTLS